MENNLESRIKSAYARLGRSEQKVADFILLRGPDAARMSVATLALQCGVSDPTVVRFANHIGFSGFSDFKLELMKDWGQKTVRENPLPLLVDLYVNADDRLDDIPAKMVNTTIRALTDTLKMMDLAAYRQAVTAIVNAGIIDIYGVGNSGSIGNDLMNKFLRIGLNARAFQDNHLQQISSLSLTKRDVAIGISHSGSTRDVVDTMKLARESGATTIALTNFKASKITEYADIELLTGDFETTFYSETMVSRISLLAIVDMLYMGVLLSDYETFAGRLNRVNKLVEKKNY